MKKIFRMALVCALAGATLLYTGCTKDYSDDIDDLKSQVSTLNTTVTELQKKIDDGCVITSVVKNDAGDGYVITTSDKKTYEIKNGADGADGKEGKEGKEGKQGPKGDAAVVTIGSDGYWYINNEKQEVKAVAQDGVTPKVEISEDGYWVINGEKQSTKAKAEDGVTPTIGISEDGYWVINGEKQSTKAIATAVTIDKDGYICLDGKATTVKAGSMAVWDQTSGTVKFYKADGSLDFEIGVCELESIVFVPQLYFEGIEAAEYDYIYGEYNVKTTLPKEVNDDESTDENKVKAVPVAGNHAWKYSGTHFSLGEIATAEYHVNPNSFDVTKADWKLEGMNRNYVTRATTETWSIDTKSVTREAGKNAVVKYQIVKPHLATGTESPYEVSGTAASQVAVMRLSGTVKNGGKTVDSDYEAIVPFRETLHHIAFTANSHYTTKFAESYEAKSGSTYPDTHCAVAETKDRELYVVSTQAMEQVPSIELNYLDSLDLASILEIHYFPGSTKKIHTAGSVEKAITLAKLSEKYPGLKIGFELVPYELGDKKSREDRYGKVDENNIFWPCYVDASGNTRGRCIDAAKVGESGISAKNRKPVVLVTISDANGVVLYGYFKIKITEKPTPKHADFIIKDLGDFAYICKGTKATTWADCSYTVLEKGLGMDYTTFKDTYVKPTFKGVLPTAKTLMTTYIKKADGTFTDVTKDLKYGQFYYDPDKVSGGVNDHFGIDITSPKQLENIVKDFNGEITLYGKFSASENDWVYFGLTFSVGNKPVVKTIEHNSSYWFIPTGHTEADLMIVNPRVPDNGYEDTSWGEAEPQSMISSAWAWPGTKSSVTGYSINLEKAWKYNFVQFEFDDATQKAFAEAAGISGKVAFGTAELPIKYHFEFSSTQTCKPEGKELKTQKVTGSSTQYLYWNEIKNDNIIACLRTDIVRVFDNIAKEPYGTRQTTPATVKGSDPAFSNVDLLYYKHDGTKENTVAKRLLNKYAHPKDTSDPVLEDNETLDYFLYADVDLVATYGTCDIPLTTETFHVAFFRPLDIKTTDVEGFKDATKGGDKLVLASVFNVTDWQGFDIFVKDATTGKYSANVSHTMAKGSPDLDWAQFYGVTSFSVNLAEVTSDQNHATEPEYLFSHYDASGKHIIGVNDSIPLEVLKVAGSTSSDAVKKVKNYDKSTDPCDVTYTIDISSSYDVLNDYVLCYSNYTAVQNFNLYVPITVNYWWGQLKGEVKIPVAKTI